MPVLIGMRTQPKFRRNKEDETHRGNDRLPPSLFGHNIMQRAMHNLHAQNPNADGVIGRMMKELTNVDKPYASEIYSLMGNVKMTEGARYAPNIVDRVRLGVALLYFSILADIDLTDLDCDLGHDTRTRACVLETV